MESLVLIPWPCLDFLASGKGTYPQRHFELGATASGRGELTAVGWTCADKKLHFDGIESEGLMEFGNQIEFTLVLHSR